jgi:excisionase family DNA binding protein
VTLHDRLRRVVDSLPEGASVSLPVEVLREWLDDEGAAPEQTSEAQGFDLTAQDAAALLDRSASTVRGWCASGVLPGAYRLQGREWRIPRGALASLRPNGKDEPRMQRRQPDLGAWRKVKPETRRGQPR